MIIALTFMAAALNPEIASQLSRAEQGDYAVYSQIEAQLCALSTEAREAVYKDIVVYAYDHSDNKQLRHFLGRIKNCTDSASAVAATVTGLADAEKNGHGPAGDSQANDSSAANTLPDPLYLNRQSWNAGLSREDEVAYEGERRRPLTGSEFYLKLGQQEYGEQYDSRRGSRTFLVIGGGSISALSYLALCCSPAFLALESVPSLRGRNISGYAGLAAAGTSIITGTVGVVMVIVGSLMDEHPISYAEAIDAVQIYNKGQTVKRVAP